MTNLRLWRMELGISAREAAQRLKIGINAYQWLETGRLAPSAADLLKLRSFFGCKVDSILAPVRAPFRRTAR